MNKLKTFVAALGLLGAMGMSSTANADLLPLPPLPVPGVCSILGELVPKGGMTSDQVIEILGKLPPGTTIQQVLACAK